jgi:outer membrane protein
MPAKLKILTLALAFGLAASTSALAQNSGAPAPSNKVGIVAIQAAIANSNEGKKELDAMQQRFAGKQNELKTLKDEVDNLQKQLQAQGDKLSAEERNNRVQTLEVKQKTLQRSGEDFQNEVQLAEQELVNRLGTKMMAVLEKYATANGFGVILDVSNQQNSVLWANQGTNITQQLIDAYNAQSPVAPSAPAAKPAGGAAANKPAGTPTPAKQP